MEHLILALDAGFTPNCWITHRDAIVYHAKGQVLEWSPGKEEFTYFGGKSRLTGERSFVTTSSIIAISGELQAKHAKRTGMVPPLSNRALFTRDRHTCAYCGNQFHHAVLTRDHIVPKRMRGENTWMNTVTSCKRCNNKKGDKLPGKSPGCCGMELLYVPYVPNKSEYLILTNRSILGDQMDFLMAQVPATSRLHA